jgi:methyl-accepting chemotaxis protein
MEYLRYFGGIAAYLLGVAVILFAAILLENQSYIDNLRKQIQKLAKEAMDLSKRIYILSYDDIGVMTEGINIIIQKLQESFVCIQKSQKEVQKACTNTQVTMKQSQGDANTVSQLVLNASTVYDSQVKVIKDTGERIHLVIEEMNKTISTFNAQEQVIIETTELYQNITTTLEELMTMTLQSGERFSHLAKVITEGVQNLKLLVDTVHSIEETNKKIDEIAQTIMNISEQSNILAINAAIEASHAGNFGKGFSIVAEEVRRLSSTTAQSASEITKLITEIQNNNQQEAALNDQLTATFLTIQNELLESVTCMNTITETAREKTILTKQSLLKINSLSDSNTVMKEHISSIEENHQTVIATIQDLQETTERLSHVQQEMMNGITDILTSFNDLTDTFDQNYKAIQEMDKVTIQYKIG